MLTELEIKHLIFYGATKDKQIVLDEIPYRLDAAFNFMLGELKPEQRDWIEKLFWNRIINLTNQQYLKNTTDENSY